MIKVQCISTNSGFHARLEVGKWYDVEEYESRKDANKYSYIIHGLGKKEHPLDADYGLYDKSLFRTLQDKRDSQLDKIL
jgi:hypothetical protein